jgi:YVTN family beta-propeller protein
VSVIDTDPLSATYNQVTDTIDVGTNPYGVAVVPDGTRAYVTNSADGTVSVIDTDPTSGTYNQVIGSPIVVGNNPTGLAVSPDGTPQRAYVANSNDGTVSVIDIDPTSGTYNQVIGSAIIVGSSPIGVAVAQDGLRVYVTDNADGTVSVIDTDSASGTYNQVIDTITVGSGAIGVVVSPDGTSLYVANQYDGTVSVIDIDLSSATYGDVVDTISTPDPDNFGNPGNPFGVAVSSDGGRDRLYVTNNYTYTRTGMWVIDISRTSPLYNRVIDVVSNQGPKPSNGVAVTPVSADPAVPTRVYRANAATNDVSVFDTSPEGPAGSLSNPYAIAFSPADVSGDVRYAYVTNFASSNVTVIDTHTYAVVAEIEVGWDPTGVAVSKAGPKKGYAYVASESDYTVAVIKPDFTVEEVIDVGRYPQGVVVSADGAYVYVANEVSDGQGDYSVSVIRTSDNTVTTITSPDLVEPFGLTIGGKLLYVTNIGTSADRDVAVIDIDPTSGTFHTVLGTVGAGDTNDDPHSVGVWL